MHPPRGHPLTQRAPGRRRPPATAAGAWLAAFIHVVRCRHPTETHPECRTFTAQGPALAPGPLMQSMAQPQGPGWWAAG